MKICTKCRTEKSLEEFPRRHDTKDGRNYVCKVCGKKYAAIRYQNTREDRIKEAKVWQAANFERHRRVSLEYYHNNKQAVKEYRQKNKIVIAEKRKIARDKIGRTPEVKRLSRMYAAKRRASKRQATPLWADAEKIKMIYLNCPEGYHVDHIIPLSGKNVSGLHIETNLQYLIAEENQQKYNKF